MIRHKLFSYHSLYIMRFAIPPLLTILFGKILFEMLIFDFPLLSDQIKTHLFSTENKISLNLSFQESKARLLWLSSVLLYFFVNIGFFAFLWGILKKRTRPELIKLMVITLTIVALEIIYLFSVESVNSPTNNLFRFPFDSISATKLFSPDKLSILFYILCIINLIAIIIIPCSILTGCCIISTKAETIAELNKQYVLLKEFIKGSSAILVVGVIHMQLWLNWPLSFLSDYAHINGLKDVISSIIQYWGICYSLTIAAFYLPIARHLLAHIQLFENDAEFSSQQLGINSLIQSASTHLPQIVAILGPMLIGTISPSLTELISF